MKPAPIKIMHIISGLNVGGAEMALLKLLQGLDKSAYQIEVICFGAKNGKIAERIQKLGYRIKYIRCRRVVHYISTPFLLAYEMLKFKPDVVQTWMYYSDFYGGLVAKILGVKKILWGIHCSNLALRFSDRMINKINSLLSKLIPTVIICCGKAALNFHESMGYYRSKMVIVRMGFDVEEFKYQPQARKDFCLKYQLKDEVLIGTLGRYIPEKDYDNFLAAAALVVKKFRAIKFCLAGRGLSADNPDLVKKIQALALSDYCILLGGPIAEVPSYLSSLDIFVMPSYSEGGLTNVIGEAMSCGIACVVTEAGDAAEIVEGCGIAVPVRRPELLAEAILKLVLSPELRQNYAKLARTKIEQNYTLDNFVRLNEQYY